MKILVTAPYNTLAREQLIERLGDVVYKPWAENQRAYKEDELIRLLQENSANALIIENDDVSEKVIAAHPGLEFIGVCRGTPSNIAMEAISNAGIPVFYTPGRNAQAVAEMFIANLITFMRNTVASIHWLKTGGWIEGAHTSYLQFKGNELAGKTIGMVGFGAIAQRIADMVAYFPCHILFYDPYIEHFQAKYQQTTIEDVFASADIVAIHLPVNPYTRGMIGKNLLSLMKPDAIFVNTARAVLVNRPDLLDVLETHRIRGAILDVFDHEPPDEIDNKIISLPNVLATPHIAGATFEVEGHHARIMNEVILDWFVNKNYSTRLLANKEILTNGTPQTS